MTSHEVPAEATRAERGAHVVRDMFGASFLHATMDRPVHGTGAADSMGRLSLEQCYGDIWSRPGLTMRDRSLVTLGLLMAAGHRDELANHVRGAYGNGLTRQELEEVALHAAPYIGFPAAGHAMEVITMTAPTGPEGPGPDTPTQVMRALLSDADHTKDAAAEVNWSDSVVYHGMGADGADRDFHGPHEMAQLLSDTRQIMDEMVDTLAAVHPVGRDLVVGQVHAHRRGARTGRTIDSTYVMVLQVTDGAIVRGLDLASAPYREFFREQAAAEQTAIPAR